MESLPKVNDTILVAIISALGLVLASLLPAVLLQVFRRENARDHADVSDRLEGIDSHIGVVEAKVEHVQYALGTHLLEHQRKEGLHNGDTRSTRDQTDGG